MAFPYDDNDKSNPRRRLTKWVDGATIGCGHHIERKEEWDTKWKKFEDGISTLSEQEQLDLFKEDLDEHTDIIRQHVKIPVSRQWYDALALFAYHLGETQFAGKKHKDPKKVIPPSTVWKKLQDPPQKGNYDTLEEAWKWWRKADDKVSLGVIRRRDEWAHLERGGVCEKTEYTN